MPSPEAISARKRGDYLIGQDSNWTQETGLSCPMGYAIATHTPSSENRAAAGKALPEAA